MTTKELLGEGWVYRKNIFDKKYYWYKDNLELQVSTYWKIIDLNQQYEYPTVVFYGLQPDYEQYKILMELL